MENLKDWIIENLLREDGTIIPARVKRRKNCNKIWLEEHYKEIYDEVIKISSNISKAIFIIVNDIKEIPKCVLCGKEVNFKCFQHGFYIYCSRKCQTVYAKSFVNEEKRKENARIANKNFLLDKEKVKERSEKNRQTCLERYGVTNGANTEFAKLKMYSTNLERYGCRLPIQNEEIHKKALNNGLGRSKIKWFNENLWYQGNLEKEFLEENIEIIDKIKRGKQIKFYDDGNLFVYSPDFQIDNNIFEIKSTWTWNNKGKNKKLENFNKNKLKAYKALGFDIFLVLNKRKYTFEEAIKL